MSPSTDQGISYKYSIYIDIDRDGAEDLSQHNLLVLIPHLSYDSSFRGPIYLSNKYIPDIRNITYFGKAQPLNLKVYTPENIKIISNISILQYKYEV